MIERGPELWARIGGVKLREVVTEFYARIFPDVMIGFMFEGKDRARLIEMEWQLAASIIGAPDIKYTGRPIREAHARTPIFGGHFERRLQILRETMRDHQIDADVQRVLIEHSYALRSQVTTDRGSECADTSVRAPAPVAPDPDHKIKLGRK
ncbi:MAG: group 1 truncated hemoglobin [Kofleriaceae bacterium]